MTNFKPVAKALTWVLKEQFSNAEENLLEYTVSDSVEVINDLTLLSLHLNALGGDRSAVAELLERATAMDKQLRARPDYGPSSHKENLARSPVSIALEEGFEPITMMSTVQLMKRMEHTDGYWIITKGGGVDDRSDVEAADWNVAAYVDHGGGTSDAVVVELSSLQHVLDHYKSIPDPQPDAQGRRTRTDIQTWADLGISPGDPKFGM